jgi:hypothetical protein
MHYTEETDKQKMTRSTGQKFTERDASPEFEAFKMAKHTLMLVPRISRNTDPTDCAAYRLVCGALTIIACFCDASTSSKKSYTKSVLADDTKNDVSRR